MEGNKYIGQECPILKECTLKSCSCPPLYTDVGDYCVPNNEVSTFGTETASERPELSSKSQLEIFLTKRTSLTQIVCSFMCRN